MILRNFASEKIWKPLPLAAYYYATSFSALSHPETLRLLARLPVGSAFLAHTGRLRFSYFVTEEKKSVQLFNAWCARSYLVVLLVSVPLAAWVLLNRQASRELKRSVFLFLFLHSMNFGNVFGISLIHMMEVSRYSTIHFIVALFAQLWAGRWLTEFGFMKVAEAKSRTPSISSAN